MADAHDLGSCADKAWEFESPLPHHVYRIHNSAGEDHLGDALHEELAHVLGVGRDGVQSSRDVLHRESILRRRTPTSGRVLWCATPLGTTGWVVLRIPLPLPDALRHVMPRPPLTGDTTLANARRARLDAPRSCRLPVHAAAANAHPCTDAQRRLRRPTLRRRLTQPWQGRLPPFQRLPQHPRRPQLQHLHQLPRQHPHRPQLQHRPRHRRRLQLRRQHPRRRRLQRRHQPPRR